MEPRHLRGTRLRLPEANRLAVRGLASLVDHPAGGGGMGRRPDLGQARTPRGRDRCRDASSDPRGGRGRWNDPAQPRGPSGVPGAPPGRPHARRPDRRPQRRRETHRRVPQREAQDHRPGRPRGRAPPRGDRGAHLARRAARGASPSLGRPPGWHPSPRCASRASASVRQRHTGPLRAEFLFRMETPVPPSAICIVDRGVTAVSKLRRAIVRSETLV